MRQAVVIFPFPQLVEAYRTTDCEETIACLKVVKESLVLMRDLDIAYAYMMAYDWTKWINAPDGNDNPLSGKQKQYRRHLEVFESFAKWCEHIFDEDPNMLAQIVGKVSTELSNIKSVIDCPGFTVDEHMNLVRRQSPYEPVLKDLQNEYIHLLYAIGRYCDMKRVRAGLQRQRAVLQRMQVKRGGQLKMM